MRDVARHIGGGEWRLSLRSTRSVAKAALPNRTARIDYRLLSRTYS